jgi:hypothetical protein
MRVILTLSVHALPTWSPSSGLSYRSLFVFAHSSLLLTSSSALLVV